MKIKVIVAVLLILAACVVAVECIKPAELDIPNAPAKVLSHITIEADKGEYGFAITACDPDEDPVTITALQMPEGMILDANDWLRWTPTNTQAGDHWVIIQALDNPPDGNSLTDTAAYLFTVIRVTNKSPIMLPFVVD